MNEPIIFLSPLTKRTLRLFYFAFFLPLLAGLFLYNVLTLKPAFSPIQISLYALLTLLWLLDYSLIFVYPTQILRRVIPSTLLLFLLEAGLAYGVAQILGERATPYIFLLAFDWYTIAIFAGRRLAFVMVIVLVGIVGFSYGTAEGWQEGKRLLGANLVWIALAVASAEVFVHQWQQRVHVEKLLAELEQAHRQLRKYAAQAEELAVARERARLAHEIHDSVGHTLTALDVQMELLVRLPPGQTEQRRQVARQARTLVKEGLANVRRAVQALRPLALETFSLPEAIARLAADFERATQIPVTRKMEGDVVPLPPALAVPLYRAAQESLTNVQRHAPTVTGVTLSLRYTPDAVTLSVGNDGVPSWPFSDAPVETGGYGLRGLRERAGSLGGTFRAGPNEAGIFCVEMTLPLNLPPPSVSSPS